MFRKLALVILALATTAAVVSPASARGHGGGRGFHGGGHHRGHFGGHRGHFGGHRGHFGHRGHHWGRYARYGYGGGYAAYYADSCYRIVETEDGPRRVYVCD